MALYYASSSTMWRFSDILFCLVYGLLERKIEKWPFFEHLVLACTIDLMNDLGLVR